MAVAGTFGMSQWLLERKLRRRTLAAFAAVSARTLAIRACSAAACFASMLPAAWVGAFTRSVSTHHWHVFSTLNETAVLNLSAQAGKYEVRLLPLLISWAVLLLVTPIGLTLAFRAAAVIAAILGYLELSPPTFVVTSKVASISGWLTRFDTYWGRHSVVLVVASIAAAYLLQAYAVRTFRRLGYLRSRQRDGFNNTSLGQSLPGKLSAACLVLLVLLAAVWAGTVIGLVAAHGGSSASWGSYGSQGGRYQSECLFIMVLLAVMIPQLYHGEKWLTAAALLAGIYGLAPDRLHVPAALTVSAGSGLLERIGSVWGAGSLWAALFLFIPGLVLGIYLLARIIGTD
jgi:hypothetical protein